MSVICQSSVWSGVSGEKNFSTTLSLSGWRYAPGLSGVLTDKPAASDIGRAAVARQPDQAPSTMRRLVPASAAAEQEASGAARTVRAKHLPEHVRRKYGPPGALHRPEHVRSVKHVFAPAPPWCAAPPVHSPCMHVELTASLRQCLSHWSWCTRLSTTASLFQAQRRCH